MSITPTKINIIPVVLWNDNGSRIRWCELIDTGARIRQEYRHRECAYARTIARSSKNFL